MGARVLGQDALEPVGSVGDSRIGPFPVEELKKLYSIDVNVRRAAIELLSIENSDRQKRILVTGGAGFVGSHLVDRLMLQGHFIIVLDNYLTGYEDNIAHWIGHSNFQFINHDVDCDPAFMSDINSLDEIYHLASPASPPQYQFNPVKTIKTIVVGTLNILDLAHRLGARLFIASTSEIYGDPLIHPQKEDYWGNVNPVGPRACYDEGKRVAETMAYAYRSQFKVDIRIARIFNTFGPRMGIDDGRVVSNFIMQALQKQSIVIYGDGAQTRSFQYIYDLIDGMLLLMQSGQNEPVNLGNPDELSVLQFSNLIREMMNANEPIVHMPAMKDDPQRRKPDIGCAKKALQWQPKFSLQQGIHETIAYYRMRYL